MRTNALLLLVAAAATAVAQSRDWPDCIQKCITENPTSSWCDGDETGDDLATCTCQSYSGSAMFPCMRKCSEADQAQFAGIVPKLCRASLFPGIEAVTTGGAAATTATTTGAETATTTAGGDTASQTSDTAPSASGTGDGNAAAGREVSGLLAAGGLLAALML